MHAVSAYQEDTSLWSFLGWVNVSTRVSALNLYPKTLRVSLQAAIVAIIAATLFLRTHLHPNSLAEGQLYSGFLFFSLLQMFFSGIAEMTFAVSTRLLLFFFFFFAGTSWCLCALVV